MKTLTIATLVYILSGPALACEDQSDKLRYNCMEDEFSYESPESTLRYNCMEDKYEYKRPGERLRYNPHQDRWEFAK